jgi:hypothetical protein
MDKTCLHCGKLFSVKPSLSRIQYCSRDCLNEAVVEVVCLVCNNKFFSPAIQAKRAKYCSDACRIKSGPIQKLCERCRKSFLIRSNRDETARFCSQKCQFETMRIDIICDQCGKVFTRPSSSEQKYCSLECCHESLKKSVWISCDNCGIEFCVKQSREDSKYCSLECCHEKMLDSRDFPEPNFILGARWISLGQNKFALIDEINYEKISKYRWYIHKGYAFRQEYCDGLCVKFSMHREIINAPPYVEVDHINGNRIDNRQSNLRLATRSTNVMNRVDRGAGSNSGYRGVHLRKNGYYQATITINYKQVYLGTYNDAIWAAKAYDDAAREYFGEFARLNFPKEGEQAA